MACFCDHGNELSVLIKFHDHQNDYQLLKENSSMEFVSGLVRIWLSSDGASKVSNSRSVPG